MEHINIEIKARSLHHTSIREILQKKNAQFIGSDHQIDTYFHANHGRLKLRQGNIENNLIYYNREDKEGPKQSDVILFKSEADSSLKQLLTASIGIKVIIDKTREIYFIENVKFHIDTVKELGEFIEIEAIASESNNTIEQLNKQCKHYMQLFNIQNEDLISNSYSDLLLQKLS